MKTFNLVIKNRFLGFTLKLLGVCGVLIMFEACYGTPKAAFAPNKKGGNAIEQANTGKDKPELNVKKNS